MMMLQSWFLAVRQLSTAAASDDVVKPRSIMLSIGGPLLSRLHRRAEALDEACLRAWGHPHDHAVRQELLSALELDGSLHPEHARPLIRHLFRQVHDHSIDLSNRIRASADNPDGVAHLISHGIPSLRRSLAALVQVLAARHSEQRTG